MTGVVVNTKIIMMILLAVFAVGLLSFLPDLDVYVYHNWAQLRHQSPFNQVQFSYMVRSQIVSLLMFSFTICLCLGIQVAILLKRVSLPQYYEQSASSFSMYYFLYASTSLGLSITLLNGDSDLVIPKWCNQVSVCVSGVLTLQGLLGYWLVRRGHPSGMTCYYYSLLLSCLVLMVLAANYIVFFFLSFDIIDQEWPNI